MNTLTTPAEHTPTPWMVHPIHGYICQDPPFYGPINLEDRANAELIVRAVNSATQHTENQRLKEELAWQEASLVNLHCALQSTAHMDPADSRIPVITGEVVRDLQVMAKRIRAVVDVESAESELARLRSVNEALVGALEDILNKYEATKRIGKFSTRLESTLAIKRWGRAQGNARELIAKHRAALAQAKEAM